jgi:hypothetical protein
MNDKIAEETLANHKYLLQEVQNRAAIAFFAAANRNMSLYNALYKVVLQSEGLLLPNELVEEGKKKQKIVEDSMDTASVSDNQLSMDQLQKNEMRKKNSLLKKLKRYR